MSLSSPSSSGLYSNKLSVVCPQEWLSRFGYLPPADPASGQLQTQEELSKAITAMQQFGGLETTGILGQLSGRHREAPGSIMAVLAWSYHPWLLGALKLATVDSDWIEPET